MRRLCLLLLLMLSVTIIGCKDKDKERQELDSEIINIANEYRDFVEDEEESDVLPTVEVTPIVVATPTPTPTSKPKDEEDEGIDTEESRDAEVSPAPKTKYKQYSVLLKNKKAWEDYLIARYFGYSEDVNTSLENLEKVIGYFADVSDYKSYRENYLNVLESLELLMEDDFDDLEKLAPGRYVYSISTDGYYDDVIPYDEYVEQFGFPEPENVITIEERKEEEPTYKFKYGGKQEGTLTVFCTYKDIYKYVEESFTFYFDQDGYVKEIDSKILKAEAYEEE